MPRVFRGEEPNGPQPGDLKEYKAKSMAEEYRPLAIAFWIVAFLLAVYFVWSVMRAPKPKPPPVQSVYIEALPQTPAR